MSKLAETIARLINLRGMTRSELAARIGVRESTVSDLLNGRSKAVRSDTLEALADVLGVSTDQLLGRALIPIAGDPRGASIVEVISAGETLGWEEVARRIKAAAPEVDPRPRPIVIPLPEKPLPVPEELKPRKLKPGEKVSKTPKGEDR